MQKVALYGIIAVVVITAGVGIAFAATSMNSLTEPSAQTNEQVRIVEHAMGTTEVAGIPKRIVVLEWVYAEDLLALGVQPVGVADIKGMNDWVDLKDVKLAGSVVDVGTRQEPNLEAITQLEPDLIIAVQFRVQDTYDQLSAIAPTIVFNPYPLEEDNIGQFEEMEQTFMAIADVVGKPDEGRAVLEQMNASFEIAAAEIRASEAAGKPFVLAQAWSADGAPFMRLFSDNGMATQIMERLGMQNGWNVEYEQYGFSDAGLEALTTVDDVSFFYIAQENDNIFETIYRDNPVWNNLQFVEKDRVYPLGGDTWTFGGPISAKVLADKVVEAVAGTETVSHALGTTEITGKPERIVAVGPEFIEHLLALGVQPAGIVEGTTFKLWYPEMSQQLEPGVADLGDYPPNLEAISQLEPDLIIGGSGPYGEFYNDFSSIAPTVLFDLFAQQGGSTQLQRMEETHMAIADIVGRHEEGTANIQNMHSRLHNAADRLEAAGLSGHKFIYVEGGVWEDAPWMNVYAENAELSLLLEEIGLENAVDDNAESNNYGFISSSLEGLSVLDGPDVHMFYTTALGDNVFEDSQYWAENPMWKNLSFVKAGQVHYLDKVYAFAGPSQAELLADKVVDELAN